MLERFREHDTICGLVRPSDWQMAVCVSDDAITVKAMEGAAVNVRNPPSWEKHFLKSLSLQVNFTK